MSYYHLTIDERSCIYIFLQNGMSIREIAKALKRNPSTISREIKRNRAAVNKIYYPNAAQKKYDARRQKCHRKKMFNQNMIEEIKNKIEKHWSPEQIYYRAKLDNIVLPSVSTIYRMIHDKRILNITMEKLRRKGKFKRPAETRGKFNVDGSRTIKKRPKSVYKRNEIGHWEGDTVESGRNDHTRKSKVCFITLAERKSRFYIAIKVPSRESKYVTPAIIEALKIFPSELVKTITFDRGKEFAGYLEIENELIREFYPKGMDLSEVNEKELEHNLKELNNRPRKCIRFKTPYEVLFE